MDISQKTKEGLLWNTLLPGFWQFFRFAISIVIARMLDPKDFGIMGIASIVIFYSDSLSNFGFSTALVQRKEITDKHISSVFTVNLAISVFLSFCIIVSAPFLAKFFNIPELRNVFLFLSPIFLVTALYTIPVTLLRRDVLFKTVSQVEFARSLIQAFVTLFLAWKGFQYWALVIGLLVGNLFGVIIIFPIVKWRPRLVLDLRALKEIFSFASWNFVAAQARLFGDYVDKLIIGKFLGPVQLGYYEKGFSIAFMPFENVSLQIAGVMFSSFSRCQGDIIELRNQFNKSIVTVSVLSFPIYFGLIGICENFVYVFLGAKWAPMIIAMQVLLLAFVINALTGIINSLNIGSGNYKKQIKNKMICVGIEITLCLWAAMYNIEVVATAILVYHGILFAVSYRVAVEHFPFRLRDIYQNIRPALFCSVLMLFVIKVLSYLLKDHSLGGTFMLICTGVVTYTALMLLVPFQEVVFLKNFVFTQLKKLTNLSSG